jgi:mono/diheme cytochrome c family protein
MLNRYFDWLSKGALCLAASIALAAGPALAADVPKGPMPEITDELVAEGNEIYIQRCSFCHGLLGDGEGPAAPYMDPRPRDFTLGTFKFRTTQSGELPLPTDLFRTVSRGLSGTGMQAFDDDKIKNGLSEHQRWAVIAYVMTFAPEFEGQPAHRTRALKRGDDHQGPRDLRGSQMLGVPRQAGPRKRSEGLRPQG